MWQIRAARPGSRLTDMNCCDSNGLDKMFAGPLVREELRAYRASGLSKRQRKLVTLVGHLPPGASVLDIGCGIGAVGTALLARGAGEGHFIDVSSAYLAAAREVAADAGVGERAAFYRDDFAVSEHPYPQADVVVLDRVVCCYPDASALLAKAARHCRGTLVFTYPRAFGFARLFGALCALLMRFSGREYRFFVHDPATLMRAATVAGPARVVVRSAGVWQLVKVSKTRSA